MFTTAARTRTIAATLLAFAAPSAAQIEFTTDARSYGAQVLRIWLSPDGVDFLDQVVDEAFFFPNDIEDYVPIDDTIELLQTEPDGQSWLSRVSHASSFTPTSVSGSSSYRMETSPNNQTCASFQEGIYEIYQDIESNVSAHFEVSAPCRVRVTATLTNATDDAEVRIRLLADDSPSDPIPQVVIGGSTDSSFDREVFISELGDYRWSARSDIRLFCAAPGSVSTGDWTTNFELLPDCNAADFEAPHGVLDLDDLTAFVNHFVDGEPEADLAAPTGSLDLADIVAFVGAFNAGCP